MKKYFRSISYAEMLCLIIFIALIHQFYFGLFNDFLSDDAYYYLQTVINKIHYGFYSMDGEHETNGFQPLWAWVLTVFFSLTCIFHPIETLYLFFIIFNLFWLVFATILLYREYKMEKNFQFKSSYLAVLTSLALLLSYKSNLFFNGMETSITLFFLIVFLINIRKENWIFSGISALFLVLSRLDMMIFFLIPFMLMLSIFNNIWNRKNVLIILKVFFPAIMGLSLFLGYNYFHFGHLMPISGILRSSFPFPNFQWFLLMGKDLAIVELFLVIGIILAYKTPKFKQRTEYKIGIIFLCLVLFTLLNFLLFQKWSKSIEVWYISIPLLFIIASNSILFSQLVAKKRLKNFLYLGICVLLSLNMIKFTKTIYTTKDNIILTELHKNSVIEYAKKLPKNARFAYTDSGRFTFWTQRYTLNLDGLINNFEYQDDLKRNELKEYLIKNRIDYLIGIIWDIPQFVSREYEPMYKNRTDFNAFIGDYKNFKYYIYSYKYNVYSDTLNLKKCAEEWRSPIYKDGNSLSVSIIYDLHKNENCKNLK